ncbi:MAG: AmmeMemoRadiSam system protein B [bacterium]|nr:AmmeMemoRadiSam system protein B [bacterium]
MSRAAVVAGRFYPDDPAQLKSEVAGYMPEQALPRQKALAVVLPHAGYVYSGPTAGATLAGVDVPENVLLLGPNHTGMGAACSLSPDDWRIPGAVIPTNKALAKAILDTSSLVQEDSRAHQREHSLEVLLPFLHYAQPNLQIAALCLGGLSFAQCSRLAQDLHSALQAFVEPVLVVASTDMNHFASRKEGSRKDQQAIERILALDAQGLYNTVRNRQISMCGVLPVSVTILLSLARGANRAELVRYTDSGEAGGMLDQVVGYAGLVVS